MKRRILIGRTDCIIINHLPAPNSLLRDNTQNRFFHPFFLLYYLIRLTISLFFRFFEANTSPKLIFSVVFFKVLIYSLINHLFACFQVS